MPSKQVIFLPAAETDLDEIWFEIALSNVLAADRTVDRIVERTNRLSLFPESGPRRPDIADEMRSITVGNYIVLYQVEETIEIVRVIHGARDLTALF